jgi:hypothetical protein
MTVVTGGTVKEMVVTADQGGHVLSAGGSRFLTLSAGYLGSLAIGGVIFTVAARTRLDRAAMVILGVLMLMAAALFVRNTFGLVFSLGTGLAMLALGRWTSEAVNDAILRVIGLTSMLYAPLDIYSDTIARSYLRSDARMLAEEIGGATVLWGVLWVGVSVVFIWWVLRGALRKGRDEGRGARDRVRSSAGLS